MEDKRFDQLAKTLGGLGDRRDALKVLLGGSLAGTLGVFGLSEAEAKKKGKGKKGRDKKEGKKERDTKRRGRSKRKKEVSGEENLCIAYDVFCDPSPGALVKCCATTTCTKTGSVPILGSVYNCRCSAGLHRCGDACTNLSTDKDNCGACGTKCTDNTPVCSDGTCVAKACDPACTNGNTCDNGTCKCGSGADCTGDNSCCGTSCKNLKTDTDNCGACGTKCAGSTPVCSGGTCVAETCNIGSCNQNDPCTCPGVRTCGTFGATDGICCRTTIGTFCSDTEPQPGHKCCAPNYVCGSATCQCNTAAGFVQVGSGDSATCQCSTGQHESGGKCVPDDVCAAPGGACNACHSCCKGSRCTKPNAPCTGPENAGICCLENDESAASNDACCSGCRCSDGKCCDASHCKTCSNCGPDTDCAAYKCDNGKCITTYAGKDTECTLVRNQHVARGGGRPPAKKGVCDGKGECVNSQCGSGQKLCGKRCIDTSQCCTGDQIGCPSGQCVNGTCIGGTCGGTCSGSFPTCGNTPGCACNASNQCVSTGSVCGGSCSSIGASCGSGCVCNGTVCVPSGGGGGGGGIFCDPRFCLRIQPGTSTCTSDCGAGQTCQAGASTGLAGTCVSTGGAACSATNCDATQCLECANSTLCRYKCSGNTTCSGGQCVAFPAAPGCQAGTSNLQCCRQSVKQGCRKGGGGQKGHGQGGGSCRRKGYRRCQQNFGTS